MEDYQTYEGPSNGGGGWSGGGYGRGNGSGSGNGDGDGDGKGYGYGRGNGNGNGNGDGYGNVYINLLRLFPIPDKYHYLIKDQPVPQRVKICYDLHNASNQEAFDVLVEWYEAVQDLDKANT